MYELPIDERINMIEANIKAQARKVFSQELSKTMQEAGGASTETLNQTQKAIDAQQAAQKALEDMLAELKAQVV